MESQKKIESLLEIDILTKMLNPVRLMGVQDFKLRPDQVIDPSFNEESLNDILKIRADGRARTNEEAFDMISGLSPEDTKKVVEKGLTKEMLNHQSKFSMQVEGKIVPQISFTSKQTLLPQNMSYDSFLRPQPVGETTAASGRLRTIRSQAVLGTSPERKKAKSSTNEKKVKFQM